MSWKDSVFVPLGAVLVLIIVIILAGIAGNATISANLVAASVSAAGLVVIVLILAMIRMFE